MRAIMASRFGGPEVLALVDLPTPEPAEGQFRVAVGRVGVGWLDAKIRRGLAPAGFGVTPPYVPGGGVAGTVTAVGSGVDVGWLGARVVTRPLGGYGGGYADTVISAPEASFLVPASVDLGDALAVLDDGSTALALLERTPVRPGDRVLVAPGVGGLGSLLVQLVTAAGAIAVAAVRGEQKMALAKELGAEAVDYSVPSWATRVGRPDVVFDGVGGETGAAALALLGDGGRFSGYGMASGTETHVGAADRQRLTVSDMSQLPTFWADAPRRVEHVLGEVAAGRLTPIIGHTYPLAEAAAAHADIEARRFVGKTILLP